MLGENGADRLDSAEAVPVLVDERYERRCGRSSSAAKKAEAAFRTSVAVLCCYKPGEKSRLVHQPRAHLRLKGARKSFS
ncbi:hypothetical protein M4914_23425 [Streptomyces somaliensis DSM 40738]|nr:hypothetical protein [Streptomyces somaliensis]MCQ0025596.1 hypothetical protein [Streptomyces somaliensis DSM 40738]